MTPEEARAAYARDIAALDAEAAARKAAGVSPPAKGDTPTVTAAQAAWHSYGWPTTAERAARDRIWAEYKRRRPSASAARGPASPAPVPGSSHDATR